MTSVPIGGKRAWYRIGQAYASVPPKNGSTSFKRAVCGHTSTANLIGWARSHSAGPFTLAEMPDDGLPRYLAVREPEDRFRSLWRSCQHPGYHPSSFVVEHGLEACNPSVLMDVIERRDNEHWERQVNWYGETVTPIPCDRLLGLLGLPERWENRTTGNPPFIPEYRLRQHYNRDFYLWNMALDFSPEDRRH